jgi:hypothetical protein
VKGMRVFTEKLIASARRPESCRAVGLIREVLKGSRDNARRKPISALEAHRDWTGAMLDVDFRGHTFNALVSSPPRVALAGYSAGGHLALPSAYTEGNNSHSKRTSRVPSPRTAQNRSSSSFVFRELRAAAVPPPFASPHTYPSPLQNVVGAPRS